MIEFTQDLIDQIQSSNRMLVVTGAGISTNSGIVDFRSPGGLYEAVEKRYNLPYPEAIFDITYFRINPKPFFKLSAELLLSDIKPSLCHFTLAELEKSGKIGHLITQNIDLLHEKAGSQKVVECHGSYRTGKCLACGKKYIYSEFSDSLLQGTVPVCECGGVIKPDVVFFGETLPEDFMQLYHTKPNADLLLVLGTSLTVQPVSGFVLDYAPRIPSILVTRDPTSYDSSFDHVFHCDLDEFAKTLREVSTA